MVFRFITMFERYVNVTIPNFLRTSIRCQSPAKEIYQVVFNVVLEREVLIFVLDRGITLSMAVLRFGDFNCLTPDRITTVTCSRSVFLTAFFNYSRSRAIANAQAMRDNNVQAFRCESQFGVFQISVSK